MRSFLRFAAVPVFYAALFQGYLVAGIIEGRVDDGDRQSPMVQSEYGDRSDVRGERPSAIPTVVFLKGKIQGSDAGPSNEDYAILQRDLQFQPSLLVVPLGSEVAFPNGDDEYHNVFSYSRTKRFDLGRYPRGQSKSVTFDEAGIVKVYCEIHPWMRAAVVVVENPYHAVVDDEGRFEIRDVPAGTYEVLIWNIDRGTRKIAVNVPVEGRTTLSATWDGKDSGDITVQRMIVSMAGHREHASSGCGGGC